MDETRRNFMKGAVTGGALLALGIPPINPASAAEPLSNTTRSFRLLLGNTQFDKIFADGARVAYSAYSRYASLTGSPPPQLSTVTLKGGLLAEPGRMAELLNQSRDVRWIAIMDDASAAVFVELARGANACLLSLGLHSASAEAAFSSATSPFLRHAWTAASSSHGPGELLASLLVHNQNHFTIMEHFLGQPSQNQTAAGGSMQGFVSYRGQGEAQGETHLHCAGISPQDGCDLVGWKSPGGWGPLPTAADQNQTAKNGTAADQGRRAVNWRPENWVEATGYTV
ncbi:MAG TPA: twin-arginine translocation signal domain-containing protein, partial [Nitrosospira sp.]|nr:twin-arginine translocation signal domain-containing protein [Nitrosospira sp.]